MLELTPQLMPIIAHVLGPPDKQIVAATRAQLTQLTKYVHGKHPGLVESHPELMSAIQD
jgi:hypothetical protein